MRVDREEGEVRLVLASQEAYLLRRALERASFVDTPANEQERILAFCSRALDALAAIDRQGKTGKG